MSNSGKTCRCGNLELGFDCVCEWVRKHPGNRTFTCEYCGLYSASEPMCNRCEETEDSGARNADPKAKGEHMKQPTDKEWAEAIACRIADESAYDADDKAILERTLAEALEKTPEAMRRLIGTGIIEESYFEE